MSVREFLPNSSYQVKMMVMISLIAFLVLVGGGILAGLISLDDPGAGLVIFLITIAGDFIYWVIGMILSVPYFRSLRYEILEDEVIVNVGIVTHSVKHVPFRTVTNITVKRDIFDRWFFNLGTLNIQTAGMSGQKGAEESLVGLDNVQEVYELVVTELRRFRGAMSPTTIQEGLPSDGASALLDEVRSIRKLLEEEGNMS
ncbi:MAG: PH domain-containing protein [Anaerolineales bacterium]